MAAGTSHVNDINTVNLVFNFIQISTFPHVSLRPTLIEQWINHNHRHFLSQLLHS